ncbi:methionyl-tRNA formyltransferase [Candidatus Microgenomates bacterium]|nr:methionyl-tRNA formyltransferase [Candidatus Microgenomates bacterium]
MSKVNNLKNKKLVFIGGRDRGLECLQELLRKGINISYIFCMPEDPHEREKYCDDIKTLADQNHIPIKITKFVRSEEDKNLLKEVRPDLIVVMGWRTIIPREIYEIPKYKSVAVHESYLPKYRGFAPVNWVVINGEKSTGVSLFYLAEGMDSGDLVDQIKVPIGINDTAIDVYRKTKTASIKVLIRNLSKLLNGTPRRKKQNEKLATYTCARIPDDGRIDWNLPTLKIYNLIRALSDPYPGAFTTYEDKKIIIQKAELVKSPLNYAGRICGRIVAINDLGVDVLTKDSILRIKEIETVAGERLPARQILKSIKGTLGW